MPVPAKPTARSRRPPETSILSVAKCRRHFQHFLCISPTGHVLLQKLFRLFSVQTAVPLTRGPNYRIDRRHSRHRFDSDHGAVNSTSCHRRSVRISVAEPRQVAVLNGAGTRHGRPERRLIRRPKGPRFGGLGRRALKAAGAPGTPCPHTRQGLKARARWGRGQKSDEIGNLNLRHSSPQQPSATHAARC